MSQLESIILGIVQGMTEFLPVSSSAHLVIAQQFLNIHEANVMFDLILHIGTTCALILVFGKDIVRLLLSLGPPRFYGTNIGQQKRDAKFVLLLIVAAIPTFIIGIFLDPIIDKLFTSILISGIGLLFTGALLMSTRVKKKNEAKINFLQAILIGTAQGLAIIPGVSRSGSTISTGILSGIEQSSAARFSLILSIPVVLGASLFHFLSHPPTELNFGFEVATGFFLSLFVGYISLVFLLKIISKGKFYLFSYYCFALGIFLILYSALT